MLSRRVPSRFCTLNNATHCPLQRLIRRSRLGIILTRPVPHHVRDGCYCIAPVERHGRKECLASEIPGLVLERASGLLQT